MAGEGSKGVKRHARKLLVASLGVAAVSYVQCGGDTSTTGVKHDAGSDQQNDIVANLVAPDSGTGGNSNMDVVANLVAPDVVDDGTSNLDVVANLVAPDAGDDGASDFDVVANLVAPDAPND